jgi:hypothetical protein
VAHDVIANPLAGIKTDSIPLGEENHPADQPLVVALLLSKFPFPRLRFPDGSSIEKSRQLVDAISPPSRACVRGKVAARHLCSVGAVKSDLPILEVMDVWCRPFRHKSGRIMPVSGWKRSLC